MNVYQIEVLLVGCVTAINCVLPGVFLVLRGVSLMSDAISHSVLLGIVLMFLYIQNLHSVFLMTGAAVSGFLAVLFTEWIIHTNSLKKDAAIGLIYPLFFSVGVILISYYARNIHLDIDMVFLGELAFVPFDRLYIGEFDFGPVSLWVMLFILAINSIFFTLFYKELKVSIFDYKFAYVLGLYPQFLYYVLMALTSVTVVGAFDVVGSIVVVALMITPVVSAYLFVNTLERMLLLSIFIGLFCAIEGYCCAHFFDVSISGSIACVSGLVFLFALFFAPEKGLMDKKRVHKKNSEFIGKKIIYSLIVKEFGSDFTSYNLIIEWLSIALGWTQTYTKKLIDEMALHNIIKKSGEKISIQK